MFYEFRNIVVFNHVFPHWVSIKTGEKTNVKSPYTEFDVVTDTKWLLLVSEPELAYVIQVFYAL